MKLHYLLTVDIDRGKLAEDKPPETINETLHEEIAAHIDSVHSVFALREWSITQIDDDVLANVLKQLRWVKEQ
jgi:hypothetical protein